MLKEVQKTTLEPSPLTMKLCDALFSVLSVSVGCDDDPIAVLERYGVNASVIQSAVGSVVWNDGKGRYVFLRGGTLVGLKGDSSKLLEDAFGKFWHRTDAFTEQLATLNLKTDKEVTKACGDMARAVRDAVTGYIILNRQVKKMYRKVDMFVTEPRTVLSGDTVSFIQPHAPYPSPNADPDVVEDWLEYWPGCAVFLDALVAARFASSRKNAYVFLKAASDWGKGMLFGHGGALGRLGVAVEISEGALLGIMKGGNSGLSSDDFVGALILLVNECTRLNKDFFRLEESLAITPKFFATEVVDLYMKMFTSADPIPGLSDTGGIDEQLANRFALLAPPPGDIKQRPLFAADKGYYVDNLSYYLAGELNARIAAYQAKGFETARRDADHVLDAFMKDHCLAKTVGVITSSYGEVRADWLAFVHDRVTAGHPDFLTFESANGLVLRSPAGCWSRFLDWHVDKSETLRRARLMHDRDQIMGVAKAERDVTTGKVTKGVLLPFVPGSMASNVHQFKYKK